MRLRALLFVPADRPERFEKAAASGADAISLDLEDSVAPDRKAFGRDAAREWLSGPRACAAFVAQSRHPYPLILQHDRVALAIERHEGRPALEWVGRIVEPMFGRKEAAETIEHNPARLGHEVMNRLLATVRV